MKRQVNARLIHPESVKLLITVGAVLSGTVIRSSHSRAGWIGWFFETFAFCSLIVLSKRCRVSQTCLTHGDVLFFEKSSLSSLIRLIICCSTIFGSPTIGRSALTCHPIRVGVGSTWMYLALSVQVGGWPKCSPLQKRKPTASTTSAPPVNGFLKAPRIASGCSSETTPWPARRAYIGMVVGSTTSRVSALA